MDMVVGSNPLKEEAEKFGREEGMQVWEVSAKTGRGVGELFSGTVAELANGGKEEEDAEVDRVVAKLGEVGADRRACCGI
jgi:hypothetical protein